MSMDNNNKTKITKALMITTTKNSNNTKYLTTNPVRPGQGGSMQGHICSTLEGGRLRGGREENLRLNFFIFFFPSTQLSQSGERWNSAVKWRILGFKRILISLRRREFYLWVLCIMHAAPYLSVYYTWVWGSPYNHILIVTPPKGGRRILLSGFFLLRGHSQPPQPP